MVIAIFERNYVGKNLMQHSLGAPFVNAFFLIDYYFVNAILVGPSLL